MSESVVLQSRLFGEELARYLDERDALKHLRAEFNIPSKADISRTSLPPSSASTGTFHPLDPCSHSNSLSQNPQTKPSTSSATPSAYNPSAPQSASSST